MIEQDHEPPSLPAVLTEEQAARVRKALAPFVAGRTARESAKALGFARMYVRAVLHGEIRCTLLFASRVAHVLGVDLDALVRGDET
ncbi:helix-turn-helix transcriptional regulator [Polyangium jinanense]|uniref:Helix-turn-helix transcriptional regulator n=1 Tax=Polyangium jinanense TaxID=2829994 RepID=A0A9X4AZ14_9BACT|nr:helix-turn-helix transcriptional regulator [Polyangium jinanense]MDC3962656.1 helix-turn-helix transcriptional regulator [Polyangium jinanense]MDC3989376.1 helix-turn-helix transcriptional regulator [Polyangium jinanense]